ncbi:2'-5' RNA ligase family protein [Herbiconiux sp. SYSU D00978]|uniref:2'-5' RNA ligase family protein n=1 Tax=Herbiconiux sp. SYSU D00978 TaxID=2812562 RepID=UPI001A95F039|nr:2'-5' RNA ligase family protein [Herbiconiux sp. SYSU D00978]
MFSIELLPDPELEQAVREQWAALAEADLPSLARHTSPTNRPHVTTIVRRALPQPLSLTDVAELLPLPVQLGGLVLFRHGDRVVVARQVVPSAALLVLQRAVREAVGPGDPDLRNTEPDAWTPHMTLAKRMTAAQLASALAVLDLRPLSGTFEGLRIWDGEAKQVTTVR